MQATLPFVRTIENPNHIFIRGLKLTPLDLNALLSLLERHHDVKRQCFIVSQNMHSVYMLSKSRAMRELHRRENSYVHIDGMPIIWLARMFRHKLSFQHRTALLDIIWPLLENAARNGRRVFYVGSEQHILDVALAKIRERVPNLQIEGINGFEGIQSTGESGDSALETIQEYQPDLIIVGLGMGNQEEWILKNCSDLESSSFITVGACFEFIAGSASTPPRWLGNMCIEWAWRFLDNPRRFWFRYLIEPWFAAYYLIRKLQ